jgi:hypothetical protein
VLKLYSFSFLFDNTDMNMIINIKLILKFKTEFILNEYEYKVRCCDRYKIKNYITNNYIYNKKIFMLTVSICNAPE